MVAPRVFILPLLTLWASIALGCSPAIGDSCGTDLNCSVNGDRVCDLARPNGACTIYGCQEGTCPENALCVTWRPEPSRLAFNACMRPCESDNNCRIDEGYRCLSEVDLMDSEGIPLARIENAERAGESFCVATEPPSAQ